MCWGFIEDELLQNEVDEVIEQWIDNHHPEPISELPKLVTLTGFARKQIAPSFLSFLDDALDSLDSEFGNAVDYDPTTPTDAMKSAEAEFVAVLLREYEVWQCEPVCTVIVDVLAWCRKSGRDLLEETS